MCRKSVSRSARETRLLASAFISQKHQETNASTVGSFRLSSILSNMMYPYDQVQLKKSASTRSDAPRCASRGS